MNPSPLIELTDVEVWHLDLRGVAIPSVTWTIAAGEFWVVAGPASSGRSALLATAAGLHRSGGGDLRIFGRALGEATEEEQVDWRRRIGFVYERGGRLFNHLSIEENIALPLAYHLDLDAAALATRVEELLRDAGLQEVAASQPSRVSRRLQQRAGLLRALAVPSAMLIADNPAGGLGQRETRWWIETLARLHQQPAANGGPLTVVVSTDDLRGWLDVADRFAVLRDRTFRVIGTREEVLASTDDSVREFL